MNSKRKRAKLRAFVQARAHGDTLQKCSRELDQAIQEFNVRNIIRPAGKMLIRSHQVAARLVYSIRLVEMSRQDAVQTISSSVENNAFPVQEAKDSTLTARKHLHIVSIGGIPMFTSLQIIAQQDVLQKLSGYLINPSNIRYDPSKPPVRGGFGEVRRATLQDSGKGISGEIVAVKALKFSMEIELERALKVRRFELNGVTAIDLVLDRELQGKLSSGPS